MMSSDVQKADVYRSHHVYRSRHGLSRDKVMSCLKTLTMSWINIAILGGRRKDVYLKALHRYQRCPASRRLSLTPSLNLEARCWSIIGAFEQKQWCNRSVWVSREKTGLSVLHVFESTRQSMDFQFEPFLRSREACQGHDDVNWNKLKT